MEVTGGCRKLYHEELLDVFFSLTTKSRMVRWAGM
jgi:hypothetical protein